MGSKINEYEMLRNENVKRNLQKLSDLVFGGASNIVDKLRDINVRHNFIF
jgi:hypothetical protein